MAERVHVLERGARPPDLTLSYGPHRDQVIDVRLARGAADVHDEPRPLVIVIHGGFWRHRYDRAHAGPQSEALADAGYVVATAEYRRVGSSGDGWQATFDDVATVCEVAPSLVEAATAGQVQRRAPLLVGHSAGGHLALWATARHRLPPSSSWHGRTAACGVICLAGVTDLVRAHELRLGSHAVRALLGGGPDEHPQRYALTNPAALVPTGVRAVLVHGADDDVVPLDLSRDYVRAAESAGDPVELVELVATGHYDLIDPLSSAWASVLGAVRRLV